MLHACMLAPRSDMMKNATVVWSMKEQRKHTMLGIYITPGVVLLVFSCYVLLLFRERKRFNNVPLLSVIWCIIYCCCCIPFHHHLISLMSQPANQSELQCFYSLRVILTGLDCAITVGLGTSKGGDVSFFSSPNFAFPFESETWWKRALSDFLPWFQIGCSRDEWKGKHNLTAG